MEAFVYQFANRVSAVVFCVYQKRTRVCIHVVRTSRLLQEVPCFDTPISI